MIDLCDLCLANGQQTNWYERVVNMLIRTVVGLLLTVVYLVSVLQLECTLLDRNSFRPASCPEAIVHKLLANIYVNREWLKTTPAVVISAIQKVEVGKQLC